MYLDNGATIDEAERWVNNTQLQVVNGFLFATTQDGFIYTYSISTLISLHALIPTPEIENHNEALKTKLLNTDFSKL